MSECYFSKNYRHPLEKSEDRKKWSNLEKINCDSSRYVCSLLLWPLPSTESLAPVQEALANCPGKIKLCGFENLHGLLYFRANGADISPEVNFGSISHKENEIDQIEDHYICKPHLNFLISNFPSREHNQVIRIRKKGNDADGCPLEHDGSRPVTHNALSKVRSN